MVVGGACIHAEKVPCLCTKRLRRFEATKGFSLVNCKLGTTVNEEVSCVTELTEDAPNRQRQTHAHAHTHTHFLFFQLLSNVPLQLHPYLKRAQTPLFRFSLCQFLTSLFQPFPHLTTTASRPHPSYLCPLIATCCPLAFRSLS